MMMSETFIECFKSDQYVTSFDVDNDHIYALSGLKVFKIGRNEPNLVRETTLFQKDGLSRALIVDKTFIYVKDFCDLHILEKQSLTPIRKLTLGSDLSSDICGMGVDEHYLYLSIRNGTMARLDKKNKFQLEIFPVTDNSIWHFILHQGCIYAGNVNGELLVIDTASMEVIKKIVSGKQNLKSIFIDNGKIITASQDKKLIVRDLKTLEIVKSMNNAHNKAFSIVGFAENKLYTISYSEGRIKGWDRERWELTRIINFPGGFGQACIEDNLLYLATRNIKGLVYLDLRSES
jgi:WD40 repeat protein